MKNFILGEFISSHDDEEINTLDSKTIMKVTNTEYETEEDFYNTYKYIYLNQNRFSDVKLFAIKNIYNSNLFDHRLKFIILKLLYYIPTLLFIISLYIPYHFENYWLYFFLLSYRFSSFIGSSILYLRFWFWIFSIFSISIGLIFNQFDMMLMILIQIISGISVLFCKKFFRKLILNIAGSNRLVEKFLWITGDIFYMNELTKEKLISKKK